MPRSAHEHADVLDASCVVVWRWFRFEPCIEFDEDTQHFHDQQKLHLDPHGADLYPELKAWADEYFYIPHRHRARGVGGIFMDDRCTGDWQSDFH